MTAPQHDISGHVDEMHATTWSCDRCTGRGELEFPKPTPFWEVEALAADAHREQQPACTSFKARMKLYDARRQLGAVKR